MHAYGIDVLDPAVTPRRVAVLLAHLPPAARGGGEVWAPDSHLLALLVDQVAALTYVTLRAHGAKVGKPKPVPRPGQSRVGAVAGAPAAPAAASPGDVKHGSWMAAAEALAGMPGMR